ncbi:MAG: TatD family hydrolase [Vicingaceae bacterium]
MELIDTHAHLYLSEFKGDIDDVVKRAKDNELREVYLPNIDAETLDDMLGLVKAYPDFFKPMLGLHPTSVKENYREVIDNLFSGADLSDFIAIGEIGIDLYWDKTYLSEQIEAFKAQIILAKQNDLPIVIHARNSFSEIFEVIDKLNDPQLRGVFHCFTGSLEQARHIMNYKGFMMGIGGVVTFKNSGLDKVLADVPLEFMVLETDAPYLAPVPQRGKRNESAYIRLVAERLASIKGKDIEEIARVTSQNARKLFGK